jgi:tRNA (cmo5U34)-methyltransferase
MSRANADFGRMAPWYRALEFLAFGPDLERARFAYLGRLSGCSDILLLGEGDGRCAARLAALAPQARILCVDSSPGMIERARRRVGDNPRVSFACADVRTLALEPGRFDAVTTFFLLDCFDAGDVATIVGRVGAALRPGAPWLFADFVLPAWGFPRARARAWLWLLYAFFRWETGLGVSSLPPSEEILAREGWKVAESRTMQRRLVRTALLHR